MNEDALEYYNTKLQLYQHTYELYLHTYDEGERNIQEFKKLTLNGLRNIGMLQNCWNELSKRSIDLAEIRMTIEDQLTVQRNWSESFFSFPPLVYFHHFLAFLLLTSG